jgi:hypothetical protein
LATTDVGKVAARKVAEAAAALAQAPTNSKKKKKYKKDARLHVCLHDMEVKRHITMTYKHLPVEKIPHGSRTNGNTGQDTE